MGWQAIQYVTGGLTLVAFVVAAAFYYLAARLRNRVEVIKSAPEKDRLEAISVSADEFRIDLTGLSDRRKSEIISDRLKIRARREIPAEPAHFGRR